MGSLSLGCIWEVNCPLQEGVNDWLSLSPGGKVALSDSPSSQKCGGGFHNPAHLLLWPQGSTSALPPTAHHPQQGWVGRLICR